MVDTGMDMSSLEERETKMLMDIIVLTAGFTLCSSAFTTCCSAFCPALLPTPPPSSPFMYRYFVANTLAFMTGFFTLWMTSPHQFLCHFYCQLLLDKNNKKSQVL